VAPFLDFFRVLKREIVAHSPDGISLIRDGDLAHRPHHLYEPPQRFLISQPSVGIVGSKAVFYIRRAD
jgi:hypothetical protein